MLLRNNRHQRLIQLPPLLLFHNLIPQVFKSLGVLKEHVTVTTEEAAAAVMIDDTEVVFPGLGGGFGDGVNTELMDLGGVLGEEGGPFGGDTRPFFLGGLGTVLNTEIEPYEKIALKGIGGYGSFEEIELVVIQHDIERGVLGGIHVADLVFLHSFLEDVQILIEKCVLKRKRDNDGLIFKAVFASNVFQTRLDFLGIGINDHGQLDRKHGLSKLHVLL